MRRWWLWVILAFLASGAFYATHNFLNGPRWALYQIGKSIHDREPRVFPGLRGHRAHTRRAEGHHRGHGGPQGPAGRRTPATWCADWWAHSWLPSATNLAGQVVKAINDPERENLPSSWTLVFAANVTRNGNYALVVLSDPSKGQRLRYGHGKAQERSPGR